MKKIFLCFAVFSLTFGLQAEVYKQTNEKGQVSFSDQKSFGSREVSIPPVMTFKAVAPKPFSEPALVTTKKPYQSIVVSNPLDESTIRDNQGVVNVSYTLDPGLKETDIVELYLDGKKQQGLSLSGIDRGEHRLYLQVINRAGDVLIKSQSIVFYLHHHSTFQHSNKTKVKAKAKKIIR